MTTGFTMWGFALEDAVFFPAADFALGHVEHKP